MKIKNKVQQRLADSLNYVTSRANLNATMKLADSDLHSFEERGIQAGILKNFQSRVMDSVEARDFITTSNYGPFLPELLPIIIAWYPNFPLKELISVQDMEQDLAYIITSELITGTNKAPTLAGQRVETPNGLRTIKGTYPSGEIFGEIIETEAIQEESGESLAALYYYPVLTEQDNIETTKLDVTIDGKVVTLLPEAVVGGKINLKSADGAVTGNIEAATGIVTIKGTVTKIEASYVWNIEYAKGDNLPTVVEDMKMVPMIAKPRVLAMKWTIFSELVKKKQFTEDIRTQTTKRVLDLLYQYLVRYILDRMYMYATGGDVTINVPTSSATTPLIDPNFKAQEIMRQLNACSMKIANNTGRIEGNRIVCGSQFKNYLEALPEQWYKAVLDEDYGFQGPRKIGKFGKYLVYYDNELPEAEAWMTYRGEKWYDAAFYLGVFMPMVPTDAINLNIDVEQAFVDMNAYRYDKPQAVVKIHFGKNV